jgi:hypothetical protein
MSEPNDDITNQPSETPRRREVTDQPQRGNDAYETDQTAPPPAKSKAWIFIVLGVGLAGLLLCCPVMGFLLLIPAVQKVREAAARAQSMNNCKQMCLAVNNIASNTSKGDIPPAYGPFPVGGPNQSFFTALLPYIAEQNLYNTWFAAQATTYSNPVKTYIAPGDPNNPGTSGLISYGSNATLLTVGGSPTLPGSFKGRTANIIVVFERTAKSGATWNSSNSYLIDSNGSSSPEFGSAASWSSYGTKATALTSAGCIVGFGDGSARVVTQSNANTGWAWAMDPNISSTQIPNGW